MSIRGSVSRPGLAIGSSGDRVIERFVLCDLRFLQSAIWFIFSSDTTDNRCGGVCHVGRGARATRLIGKVLTGSRLRSFSEGSAFSASARPGDLKIGATLPRIIA